MKSIKFGVLAGAALGVLALQGAQLSPALAQGKCPAITVADDKGIKGKYPQQFELAEFEKLANCKMSFSENPNIAKLNDRIRGNPKAPPLADRLPGAPESLQIQRFSQTGRARATVSMRMTTHRMANVR